MFLSHIGVHHTIGNPFLGGALLVFDMAIALGGHAIAPLDTGIVVIVEMGGGLTVVNGVSKVGEG